MNRIAMFVALVALCAALTFCAGADPRAPVWGAQRTLCVQQHDAAADVRACVKALDEAYGQDAGVK